MPSTKRRRTNRESSKSDHTDSSRSSSVSPKPSKAARRDNNENKENKENKDNKDNTKPSQSFSSPVEYVDPLSHSDCGGGFLVNKKAPYEYICIHRPLFDVISENWRLASKGKVKRLNYEKKYEPGFIAENKQKVWGAPPEEHKKHKWIIMMSAWEKYDNFCRRVKYCDPDNFNMYIYKHFKGYGVQEIVDNAMVDFDKAFRIKGGPNLDEMWAIISAIGLWTNVEDVSELIHTDDADKCCALVLLLGCALLTTLSALAQAGELHPKSRFLDLALVIGHYLELSHDLPSYGIEGACVSWRREAVKLFHKARLDPKKGLYDTLYRLKQLEKASNYDYAGHVGEEEDRSDQELLHHEHGTERDPWAWRMTMDKYRKSHMVAVGKYPHDITKLTRAQRAAYCFDERDPLADVPVKDLRNNLLDFVW
ncbi:hypothetical protein FB567DRAFT_617809 [Paraphoma chrysanthemicola]|uniref:Uncharacterized protein n=1 Tax=Paraphoma chrysanthemicola TaxID=798071 RepID=A0A8K0R8V5_9PLEO|nr:hypothetical protein FB567DRAFT_617809 [Paraphoma chrysanthemicola]